MQSNVDVLVEMIKFDMQQIQTYRELILKVAIMCVAASWSISAFLWAAKDRVPNHRLRVAMTVNAGLFLVLVMTAVGYFKGLDTSRSCLERRESALKAWMDNHTYVITSADVYPNNSATAPHMSSQLEKFPVYISGAALVAMSLIEYRIFKKCWGIVNNIRHSHDSGRTG